MSTKASAESKASSDMDTTGDRTVSLSSSKVRLKRIPKSGRQWKLVQTTRTTKTSKRKAVSSKWKEKMKRRFQHKSIVAVRRQRAEVLEEERKEMRRRRLQKKRQKEENERKGMVVVPVSTQKVRKMSRKQLKFILKADTRPK